MRMSNDGLQAGLGRMLMLLTFWLPASGALAESFADQAPERLAEYLQIDTVNPPGNETRGVAFFARYLDAAGIRYETGESAPGRGNLWARLPANGGVSSPEPGLVLLNHIDVVPANKEYWRTEPLGGEIRDGYILGRGALDMKGVGVAQFQAFLALAASGKKRNRDVWFVATADEEAGGAYGAGWLQREHPEIFENVGFLLNEGGGGTVLDGKPVFMVEVTQKVPFWFRLTAEDAPGHGSVPGVTTAVTRLLRAGARLADTAFPVRVVPAVQSMFGGLAPYVPETSRSAYADIATAAQDENFVRTLHATSRNHHALLRNTCAITRLQGSSKINVVPPVASLEVDCRLLPDQDQAAFREQIDTVVNDPNIRFEQILAFSPAVTPAQGPLFEAITAVVNKHHRRAAIVPSVSTGFTDSHFFRDQGIASYGFSGFLVPPEDFAGVHGNDERIAVDTLVNGTELLIDLVRRFATR
ncbi:MAG: M20/M25/M40 family metallo-hydrolase [Pseudomonadales bacterium]